MFYGTWPLTFTHFVIVLFPLNLFQYLVMQHKAFAPWHSSPVHHKQQIARCCEGCHCSHPTTINDAGVFRIHPVPLSIDHQVVTLAVLSPGKSSHHSFNPETTTLWSLNKIRNHLRKSVLTNY